MTKVVHCKRERYDVYIGRGPGCIWGNPFSHKDGTLARYKVDTREEAVEKYRKYILNKPELLERLHEFKGKVLGCWCAGKVALTENDKPFRCHGQVLLELLKGSVKMKIEEVLKIAKSRTERGSKDFFKPLDEEQSKMIREYFKSKITIPLEGNKHMEFRNKCGTLIATGYQRIVVGDFGPFVELDISNLKYNNIKEKWPGSFKKTVKYVWFHTLDDVETKIYCQRQTVPYADYRVGMYYAHVSDLIIED